MRFPVTVTSLIARALADLRLPASQIADQLSGGQVAPAGPGSPGVIDLDAIPAISSDDPQALGAAAPGATGDASDAGHVHPLPDAAAVGAEPALGNPGADGYVLASLAGGTRLWVPQSGGAPLSDATPHAPGTAAPGTGTAASRADHVHAPPTAAQISDLLETTQDAVAAMIAAGANIGLAYNDSAGTLTISVSGVPSHASSHAGGGADPITPADIGAVAKAGDTMSGVLNILTAASSAGMNIETQLTALYATAGFKLTTPALDGVYNFFTQNNLAGGGGAHQFTVRQGTYPASIDFILYSSGRVLVLNGVAAGGSPGATIIGKSSGLTGSGDCDIAARCRAATFETAAGSKWQLAGYTSAADAASNGYVTVTIDGVARKLMTRA